MCPLPDSSSAVHFRLALIPIPEYARGIPVSQTLSTKALYQSTFGWFDAPSCKTAPVVHPAITRFLHLIYSMQNDKSADVLLLGTPCCRGGFRRAFLSEGHGTAMRESAVGTPLNPPCNMYIVTNSNFSFFYNFYSLSIFLIFNSQHVNASC